MHDALLESLEAIRGVTEKPGKAVIKTGDFLWFEAFEVSISSTSFEFM